MSKEHTPADLVKYLNQIISRNREAEFLRHPLATAVALEQELRRQRRETGHE